MKDHLLALFGILLALIVAVCAFAPWQDTDDAAARVREKMGEGALLFGAVPQGVGLCDGISVEKIPFGVRVGGGECPDFASGAHVYFVTFWGGVYPSEN